MPLASTEDAVAAIKRAEGNLRKAAGHLQMSVDNLYIIVKRDGLWPIVNEARINRVKGTNRNALIGRARRVLKG